MVGELGTRGARARGTLRTPTERYRPTTYAAEVVQAVVREGLVPTRTGAEHIPITAWSEVARHNAARR